MSSRSEAMPDDCSLSFLTPVHNREKLLRRTLASFGEIPVDHRNGVQIVLIDDGSTDGSRETIERFASSGAFPRVVTITQPNSGPSGARNAGLRAVRGRWLMLLDSDDELACDPLPLLQEAGDASALLFSAEYRRRGRRCGAYVARQIDSANHLDFFTAASPMPPCAIAFRRDLVRHVFREQDTILEDWSFWIDNPQLFRSARVLPHVVSAFVHIHQGNRTTLYEERGEYRASIARRTLQELGSRLTAKQRNNLLIQETLGEIQQGHARRWTGLGRWPCDRGLYVKLIASLVLGRGVAVRTDEMSAEEIGRALASARRRIYFSPRFIRNRLGYVRDLRDFGALARKALRLASSRAFNRVG